MIKKLSIKDTDLYYIDGDIFYISRWGHFNKVKICDDGKYLKCRTESLHRVLYCFYNDIPNINIIKDKYVHHIDENKYNNSKENLMLIEPSEHTKLHSIGRKHTEKSKQKMSIARKGKHFSEEHRKKLAEHLKNIPWTKERLQHMSDSCKKKRSIKCIETNEVFDSIRAASRKYGHIDMIKLCLKGKTEKACGLHWEYNDNQG